MKQNDTDLLFASAALRAREAKLLSRDRISEAASGSLSEVERLIGSREVAREVETLSERLSALLAEAYEYALGAGAGEVVDFLRYKYDCSNIKVAIKSFFGGITSEGSYFPMGTVNTEFVRKMPETGDYGSLPRHMAQAAEEAHSAYVKTGSAGMIDRLLDRACFLDMLESAEKSGGDGASELVRLEADLKNIMICFRAVRGGRALLYLRESLIPSVGSLDVIEAENAARAGETALREFIAGRGFRELAEAAESGRLSELERVCDDIYNERAAARFLPFGAPVVISYLTACECEVKNLRILLAAKRAGFDAERIKLMLRKSYV